MLLHSIQQSHLTSESHQLLTETSGWLFIGLTENGPNYVNTKMTLSAWTAKVQLRTMITMQLMLKHAINWLRAAYLWLVYPRSINTLLSTLTHLYDELSQAFPTFSVLQAMKSWAGAWE